MKYNLENKEFELELAKNLEEIEEILKENGKTYIVEELPLIYEKFKAIKDNMHTIKQVALQNAEQSTVILEDGTPTREQEIKDTEALDTVESISLDLDWAYDEFFFKNKADEPLPSSCSLIEVVTREVAEENDLEYLKVDDRFTKEDIEHYKVGEVLSEYSKLTDKFYFKFL